MLSISSHRALIQRLMFALALSPLLFGCSPAQQDSLFHSAIDLARGAAELELKQQALSDVNMSYLERSGNGPVLLLLHGFSANKDNWVAFAHELPEHYRLIVPDLAGHGDTPAPEGGNYDLFRQAERLHELINGLGIQQFHIAGNSMGGAISAIYTSLYPQQIQSLTLIDAAGVDSPQPSEYMQLLEKGENPLIATDQASFEFRMGFTMSEPPFLPWPLRPALMRDTLKREEINRDIFADMLATRERLVNSGFEQILENTIKMPTLIIWGDEDRVLDVSAVEVFKRHIPHAQVKIYQGIGHLPMVEIPQQTAKLYHNFVSSVQ